MQWKLGRLGSVQAVSIDTGGADPSTELPELMLLCPDNFPELASCIAFWVKLITRGLKLGASWEGMYFVSCCYFRPRYYYFIPGTNCCHWFKSQQIQRLLPSAVTKPNPTVWQNSSGVKYGCSRLQEMMLQLKKELLSCQFLSPQPLAPYRIPSIYQFPSHTFTSEAPGY